MGNLNCVSSSRQKHIRVREDGPSPSNQKRKNAQNNKKQNDDGVTAEERIDLKVQTAVTGSSSTVTTTPGSDSDATAPMTPQSILSAPAAGAESVQRPNRLFVKGADISSGADQPMSSPGESKVHRMHQTHSAPSAAWTNPSENKGRALQQRLQKARYMQLVMSSPMDGDGTHPSFPAAPKNASSRALNNSNNGFALDSVSVSEESGKTKLSNDEFEASLHQGMIWAEMDGGSAILAVALSRLEPTVGRTSPPLFLAVGTDAGVLIVTELLNCSNGPRTGVSRDLKRQGRIRTLDFLPGDGNCLAVGGDDGICALVGLKENGALHQLAEITRRDRIYAAKFSPDAQFLAIGGYDATVAILDVTSLAAPRLVSEIPVDGLISTLAWSPDSQYLAIGGSDKLCSVVCQNDDWEIIHEIRRSASITSLEWHPQGKGRFHLAIGSNDVILVDHESFQVREEISFGDMAGRAGQIRINGLCWSPNNGKYLVVCANNQRARLLETKTFSTIQEIRHNANINCVVWGQQTAIAANGNPHQQYLAVGGDDGKVLILKAGPTDLYGTSDDNTSTANSSYFSNRTSGKPQQQSGEGWVLHPFRDMEDDDGSATVLAGTSRPSQLGDINSTVRAMSFSKGSKSRPSAFFATASVDGFVTVRSTVGFKILCQLEFLDPITCIAFSHGSQYMACGSNDGKVRVVATAPIWTVALVIDAETPVTGLSFSNNNERLAIIGIDGSLTLVNPKQDFSGAGELEQESTITAVDWSADHLAAGQEDGIVCIYDTKEIFNNDKTEFQVCATIARPSPVRSLAFGANGRFLVVGGDDGTLGIFSSAGDWALVHHIAVGFEISCLKWSPSGRHMAVTGGDPNMKEKQVQVVDTVFWANVEEAQKIVAVPKGADQDTSSEISRRRKIQSSSLCFSQDGKFMAFNYEECGTRVVSTMSWDIVFNLQQQGQELEAITSSNSSPDDNSSRASSYLSSPMAEDN